MSVTIRDCIVCIPVWMAKEAKVVKGSIQAACGLCRQDVWLSQEKREMYTAEPDRFIVACMPCAFDMYKTMIDRQPDVLVESDQNAVFVDLKGREDPGDHTIVMPTWALDGIEVDVPHRCEKCDPTFKEDEE
jgi:hypothetical protein